MTAVDQRIVKWLARTVSHLRVTIFENRFLAYSSVQHSKGLDTCYSAAYMSQTRDQQRFTISEVAAHWRKRRKKTGTGNSLFARLNNTTTIPTLMKILL